MSTKNSERSQVSEMHRADIQGLRAVAVLLVVVYHAWPAAVPGGYVGVDAFFALSGYLISRNLLREVENTGAVALRRFWSRRVRRLVPAAFVVLLGTALGVLLWVPQTLWRQFFREIAASGWYGVNWVLAFDAVDYLAAENAPSPVQHFWSLAIEEQFYLVWPLLFAATAWALTSHPRRFRWTIAVVMAIVVATSLWYSITRTASSPGWAYLVTPARAWEFAIGGLAGLLPRRLVGVRVAIPAAWAGLGVLVASALVFSDTTPFPGWRAAVPVLATLMVVVADAADRPTSPTRWFALGPVQWTGDASYSLYLWHWPVLVLWPYATGREPTPIEMLVPVAMSVALAALSYSFVEDPIRRSQARWVLRPSTALAAVAISIVTLVTIDIAVGGYVNRAESVAADESEVIAAQLDDAGDACYGAGARLHPDKCGGILNPESFLTPDPLVAVDSAVRPVCMTPIERDDIRICERGVSADEAVRTVAIAGDSHAGHWRAAIEGLADQHRWRVLVVLKGSCPFNSTRRATSELNATTCERWNEGVPNALREFGHIDVLFTSGSSRNEFVTKGNETSLDAGARGYLSTWAQVAPFVDRVVVLRDIPRPRADNVECIEALDASQRLVTGACGETRKTAEYPDPAAIAAGASPRPVSVVDVNDLICDETMCNVVVGNAMVYRDSHHMTAAFAETLTPAVAALLPPDLLTSDFAP